MFPRIVYESFRRQARRKLLAGIAITLGVAVATAMIAVATDIGDKINRELRSYGANLVVTPQEDTLDVEVGGANLKPPSDGAFLNEADLPKIRGTFWHHNIVGFSPMLPVTVRVGKGSDAKDVTLLGTYFNKALSFGKDEFTTGVRITHPWWKVLCGNPGEFPGCGWPDDSSQNILVGERLASKLDKQAGNTLDVAGRHLTISGILSTGGAEDDQIVAPLALAQQILGKPGAVRRVYVSAMTKPPDALSVRDPKTITGGLSGRRGQENRGAAAWPAPAGRGQDEEGTVIANRGEEVWQTKAACRGPHAIVFFPPSHAERKEERIARERAAKEICRPCPVR